MVKHRNICGMQVDESCFITPSAIAVDDKRSVWVDPECECSSQQNGEYCIELKLSEAGYVLPRCVESLGKHKISTELDFDNMLANKWLHIIDPIILPRRNIMLQKMIKNLEHGEGGYIKPGAVIKNNSGYTLNGSYKTQLSRYYPVGMTNVHIDRINDVEFFVTLCQYKTESGLIEHYCTKAALENWSSQFIAKLEMMKK